LIKETGDPAPRDATSLEMKSALIAPIRGKLSYRVMPIAYLTLELRIEAAHSLKDKRQVLRSVKDRLRNSFNVSVAEIDGTDLWQRATIGVVSISDSRDYLEGLMRNVEREATKLANNAGAEVVDSFLDYLET
jgi:uncharacterized protein YlxP (DUF503 family)